MKQKPLDPSTPLLLLHSPSKQCSVAVYESFHPRTNEPVWRTAIYTNESITFPGPMNKGIQIIERKLPYAVTTFDRTKEQLTELLILLKEAAGFIEQRRELLAAELQKHLKNTVAKRDKARRGIHDHPNQRTAKMFGEE